MCFQKKKIKRSWRWINLQEEESQSPPCSHSRECATLLNPPPPLHSHLGRGVDSGGGAEGWDGGGGVWGSSGTAGCIKIKIKREGPDQLW